jgi:hypothetical protein
MEKNECKVERREGDEVMVKFWPDEGVLRKIEKLSEKGMSFEYRYGELGDIVNEVSEDGRDIMEVIDSDRSRNLKGVPAHFVTVRLGEGGRHLKDEEIEYIIDWALGEYGKRGMDKRIGYLPF